MKICTNCGAENHQTATYCITCGLPLTDSYPPLEQITGGRKPRVVIVLAVAIVIAIAGFAGALFMVTGVNTNKNTSDNGDPLHPQKNVKVTEIEEPAVAEPAIEPPSANQKLKNVKSPGKHEIDDATLARITTKITHFINKNNKEDVDAILDYFNYPVNRYHSNYNVSRVKLRSLLQNKKDAYHNLRPSISNGTVAFDGRNYEVVIFALYQWATLEEPDYKLSKKLRLKYILNKNLQITSAYEM